MVARSTKWGIGVCVGGAILVLLGGLLGWVAFPAVVESTVADTVAVKNGTDAWDRWIELPLPMNFKVYIFDVQNPEEITKGEPPVIIQKGPYVYTETRNKIDIDYREDENRASYLQQSHFEFNPELSNGSDKDYVIVPNVPLVAFAQITESIESLASSIGAYNKAIENLFEHQYMNTIFTRVTVGDYLFGELPMNCQYNDILHLSEMLLCAAYRAVAPRTVNLGPLPGINTFSFFRYKNTSTDGRYEVQLGIEDVEQIGQVMTWDNKTHDDKWGGESCNAIFGTDSTIFRPKLDEVEELYVYNTDICRTIKLTYKEDTEYKEIAGRRYVADKNVFASVQSNNDNYCYCPQSVGNLTTRGGCLKDGALELSSCQGAPVILTHPHFLFADESYKMDSLAPKEEDHQIFLDLEPYTGSPLRGASRIQMNIFLKPIEQVDMMKNFPSKILPILWIEEGVELNDDLLNMLNEELFDILDILEGVRWALIGVGIAVMAGSGGFLLWKKMRS